MAVPEAKQYIEEFEKLGFGLFVHWGLYSQLSQGEWTYAIHKRKMEEYKKLKDTFTAEDFDAEKLVSLAKNAGCKYITCTARHHEGFSLYDTCGLSDFDAVRSPAKRDLVREFVNACNKHGVVPFLYHTTLDWYNEDFNVNFEKYLEYLRKSVEILCKNYGRIGGFWFDGNWSRPEADWKEDELYQTIRKYQPEAIIVNNTGLSNRGAVGNPEIDSVTFEQGTPEPMNREGMSKYLAAEMCQTINNHWGIADLDIDYKSPRELIEALCECRKVGANYLLNIGPTAQGGIAGYQKELIETVGKWMKLYGDAIYNGRPCNAKGCGRSFILKGDNELYLFFFGLQIKGDENVVENRISSTAFAFENVKDRIESIEWLDNGERLGFVQNDTLLSVNATKYPYGMATCVRVARARIKFNHRM